MGNVQLNELPRVFCFSLEMLKRCHVCCLGRRRVHSRMGPLRPLMHLGSMAWELEPNWTEAELSQSNKQFCSSSSTLVQRSDNR